MASPNHLRAHTYDSIHSLQPAAPIMHTSENQRSLKAMTIRIAQRHIKEVTDVGDAPFALVKPIIDRITSPQQLLALQKASPQIATHTGYKWLEFIKRDIPSWSRNKFFPDREELWWQIYQKARTRHDADVDASIALLVEANAEMAAKKAENKTQYDNTLLYAPDAAMRRGPGTAGYSPPIRQPKSAIMAAVLKESSKVGQTRPQPTRPRWKMETMSNRSEQPPPAAAAAAAAAGRRQLSHAQATKLCNDLLTEDDRKHRAERLAARARAVQEAKAEVLEGLDTIRPRTPPPLEDAADQLSHARISLSPSLSPQSIEIIDEEKMRAPGEPAPLYAAITPLVKRVRPEASCFMPAKRARRH